MQPGRERIPGRRSAPDKAEAVWTDRAEDTG